MVYNYNENSIQIKLFYHMLITTGNFKTLDFNYILHMHIFLFYWRVMEWALEDIHTNTFHIYLLKIDNDTYQVVPFKFHKIHFKKKWSKSFSLVVIIYNMLKVFFYLQYLHL